VQEQIRTSLRQLRAVGFPTDNKREVEDLMSRIVEQRRWWVTSVEALSSTSGTSAIITFGSTTAKVHALEAAARQPLKCGGTPIRLLKMTASRLRVEDGPLKAVLEATKAIYPQAGYMFLNWSLEAMATEDGDPLACVRWTSNAQAVVALASTVDNGTLRDEIMSTWRRRAGGEAQPRSVAGGRRRYQAALYVKLELVSMAESLRAELAQAFRERDEDQEEAIEEDRTAQLKFADGKGREKGKPKQQQASQQDVPLHEATPLNENRKGKQLGAKGAAGRAGPANPQGNQAARQAGGPAPTHRARHPQHPQCDDDGMELDDPEGEDEEEECRKAREQLARAEKRLEQKRGLQHPFGPSARQLQFEATANVRAAKGGGKLSSQHGGQQQHGGRSSSSSSREITNLGRREGSSGCNSGSSEGGKCKVPTFLHLSSRFFRGRSGRNNRSSYHSRGAWIPRPSIGVQAFSVFWTLWKEPTGSLGSIGKAARMGSGKR